MIFSKTDVNWKEEIKTLHP